MGRRPRADVPDLLEALGIDASGPQAGGYYWASCPSPEHRDSDPSWRILDDPGDPDHARHHCFGCGFGGYPVHLVEAVLYSHVDDEEERREMAREWLDGAREAAVPLEVRVEVAPTRARRELRMPGGVKFKPLDRWPKPARQYALGRGLEAWQVTRWGLGYAAEGRLRGRLVFPVRDGGGKLIGYTARSFTGARRKYLEPSEGDGATPGAVFGEQHWPPPERRRIVVAAEGALDVLAVERMVRLPIAGLYGSNLASRHIQRLSTFGVVVMASDPDAAGDGVAGAVSEALARWVEVRRLTLPTGTDCASLWVEDRGRFCELLRSVLIG